VSLLAGYFYAFAIAGRLSLKVQAILQFAILSAAALTARSPHPWACPMQCWRRHRRCCNGG
jgi:hypothetical protein